MHIHEKLMLCALDLLDEYHLESIDIVGELCQAGHMLSAFSDDGLRKLREELKTKSAAQVRRFEKAKKEKGNE